MKYIKHLMLSALVLASFTSCEDDDTDYTYRTKALVTIDNVSESAITEGESVTVTLTVDTPYKETLDFKLEMISGGNNADFNTGDPSEPNAETTADDGFGSTGYLVQIPAYASSYTFQINSLVDLDVEGTEKYTFRLTNTRNSNALISGNNIISFDVANYEDDNMGLRLSWSKTENYQILKLNHEDILLDDDGNAVLDANGDTIPVAFPSDDQTLAKSKDLCDVVDFDMFLDAANVFAYTGDCPELAMTGTAVPNANNTEVLADGTYQVIVDMWTFDLALKDDESLIGSFAVPIEIEIAKTGKFKTSISYPSLYFSYTEVSDDVAGSGERVVATVVVTGGKYTVYDNEGTLVAQE
ncbi:hypothetical protein [Bizionia myxarmorum]|uniref:DUF1735 domain-containing protein n=1 Tax=Bizionia myxarmorum TaxID=291186 RepID=A0A5D0RCE4_9FLAO|nr:hypothetical protein [Bizionia myxarmorum]TYB79340.1 hypothetical protein ES674_06085 [Bizionia myxarmorum]